MLFANYNRVKSAAQPNAKGICPLCERGVIARCGEINVWHWAHEKGGSCEGDDWHEPETEWHKRWKTIFGDECSEVVIEKAGIKHRADILTSTRRNDQVVIELQNSPISSETIRKREDFYGKRMIWVINGIDFKKNFEIIEDFDHWDDEEIFTQSRPVEEHNWNQFTFSWRWQYYRRSWEDSKRPVFIDFGDDYLFWMKNKDGFVSFGSTGKKVPKSRFIRHYNGDLLKLPQ